MIIALGHRKRVGKTEAAQHLKYLFRIHGVEAHVVHFADIIKQVAHILWAHKGIKSGSYYEQHPEEKEIARPYWIEIGEVLTGIDQELFYYHVAKAGDYIIVPDLRRETELNLVKQNGGLVFRIDRKTEAKTDKLDEYLANYTKWDAVIDNNGSLGELKGKLTHVFNALIDPRIKR